MKKVLLYLILVPLLLSACKPDANLENLETGGQSIAGPAVAVDDSVAVCTAQSTEAVDLVQPGDWVTGPEDYSVTLIEYGDFQ